MQAPFQQNIIAVIWDFDKTLAKEYMQRPIFEKYQVNEKDFWDEINSLEKKYKEAGIKINPDTVYLNHFLTCVEQGIFPGLNNEELFNLGTDIKFYEGLPDFFKTIKDLIETDDNYGHYQISVEHYIVSTGLAKMIEGSAIAPHVDDIWGCEFIEEPIQSQLEIKEIANVEHMNGARIKQVAYAIDNTSKTRALFEINKGVNKHPEIDVNSSIHQLDRRIPFSNMIYIADGPSDVPAFSIIKQNGGKAFAVYPKGNTKLLNQVDQLRRDGRIDMYGEADYQSGTLTHLWLTEHVKKIADRIYLEKKENLKRIVTGVPEHVVE